jgi:hypothetical protein
VAQRLVRKKTFALFAPPLRPLRLRNSLWLN